MIAASLGSWNCFPPENLRTKTKISGSSFQYYFSNAAASPPSQHQGIAYFQDFGSHSLGPENGKYTLLTTASKNRNQ
jgi:hypothetical protein